MGAGEERSLLRRPRRDDGGGDADGAKGPRCVPVGFDVGDEGESPTGTSATAHSFDTEDDQGSPNTGVSCHGEPPTGTGPSSRRTGAELWDVVRRQVRRMSFQIDDRFEEARDGVRIDEAVDLPYDFSVRDCCLPFCVYLAIGVVAYSFVFEKWTVIDSMYFAVVTFTTIGYGDLSPTTQGGRLFCSLFALAGVAVLAIGLSVVGTKIIEGQVARISKAEDRIVRDVFRVFQPGARTAEEGRDGSSRRPSPWEFLDGVDDPSVSLHDELEDAVHPWRACVDGFRNFGVFLLRYLPALSPLLLGSYFIGRSEGWAWYDCIYYSVVTLTTVGYGDFAPGRQGLRALAVLFVPLAVGAMGHFLGTVADIIIRRRCEACDKRLWRHEVTLEDLSAMGRGRGEAVTEPEFVILMLRVMRKADGDLVDRIREHFRHLDSDGSGTLDRNDLELMARDRLRGARSKLRLAAYKADLIRQGAGKSDSSEGGSGSRV